MPNFCTHIIVISLLSCLSWSAGAANAQKQVGKAGKTETVQNKAEKPNYRKKLGVYAHTFFIDNKPFFCDEGIYYKMVHGKGYEVIDTPKDVTFKDLPYGARKTYVNGYTYYNADGMWFRSLQGVFLIVSKPGATTPASETLPTKTYQATFVY